MGAKLTSEEFVKRSVEIHGDRYDYSKVVYTTARDKVVIICKTHGEFSITPANHTHKSKPQGCSCCGRQAANDKLRSTKEEFVKRSVEIHGDQYDYSKVVYTTARVGVDISCNVCGNEFVQLPSHHLAGHGCNVCAATNRGIARRMSLAELPIVADYNYHTVYHNNGRAYINMTCECCGHTFDQYLNNHRKGHGCPSCGNRMSIAEKQISTFVEGLNIDVQQHDRKIIGPKELDIVIPDYKLAIEYCGLYWHSELQGKGRKYHLEKLKAANDAGYRLITIFEDEWKNSPDIVKARLAHMLGKSSKGYGGRKLTISEIDSSVAKEFLNRYHIQGATTAQKIRLGAYHGDELVAVMTFSPTRVAMGGDGSQWELVRFVTDGRNHAGVAGKLFRHFIKMMPGTSVISYADLRWSDGGVYESLGFEYSHQSQPNYWYIGPNQYVERKHRFGFQKAKIVECFDADPVKTEWQIMQENGYDRIWDCGNLKYIYDAK